MNGLAIKPGEGYIRTVADVVAASLSGYRVYYGTAPRTYFQRRGNGLKLGNVTSFTVTGVSSGTRYYFVVTAFDSSGNESAYSNEVFKDTQ